MTPQSPTGPAEPALPTVQAQARGEASKGAATPRSPRRWLRRSAMALLALAGLLLLTIVSAAWWLPAWLEPRIQKAGQEWLGTPVRLAALELRPWKLSARVADVQIGSDAAPLLRLASAEVTFSADSLWQRLPIVSELTLRAPELWVRRDAQGPFNFEAPLAHLRARLAALPPSPADAPPARWALHNLKLEGGLIHFRDDLLAQRHEVRGLTLGLPFVSNLPSDVTIDVAPQLAAEIDGSRLQLGGHGQPFAAQRPATLELHWKALPLAPLAGLLKALMPPEQAIDLQQGVLDSDLALSFEERPAPQPHRLAIKGRVAVRDFRVAAQPLAAGASWQALTLDGLDLAPLERRYLVQSVTFDGLASDLTLAAPASRADARATPAAAAASVAGAAVNEPAASAAGAHPPALVAEIGELRCRGCRVAVTDRRVQPPARAELREADLTLTRLSADLGRPIGVLLRTGLATAAGDQAPAVGRLELQGDIRPEPLDLQATLGLQDLDLRVAQPYLAPELNLVLAGAKLGGQGKLALTLPPKDDAAAAPALRYSGRLGVAGLRSLDSVNGADFVAWKQLGFDGLDVSWQRRALDADLGRITLDGLAARLILHPDGHLNVADIVKRDNQSAPQSITTPRSKAAAAPASAAPAASAAAAAATPSPHRIRWQAITLRDGAVHFSDTFIRPNYSARLTRLQGRVSALSSATPQPADVQISGALDDGAPLSISGRIHPLGARLYTDIEARARGIALTRLSTYAERWAGYAIEKGSLSVQLQYKIDQGRLEAQNQLFLDQLTFGEPVASPDATKLPVLLAVSLLKNRRGEIDLHLPVAGTLDDPQFSVGGIVWKMILNLFEKALTAPFSLLMGGDGGETAQVDFTPGSADLTAAGRERLDALAAKLADRPALKLEATGHADPQRDGAALRAAAAQGVVKADTKASPVTRAASSVPSASASTSASTSAAAAASAPAATAPLTAAQLAAMTPALQALADRRADVVMAYLAGTLPPERILITRSVVSTDAGTGPNAVPPDTAAPASAVAAGGAAGGAAGSAGTTVQFTLR